jgi:mRNA interferase RelE/StbE
MLTIRIAKQALKVMVKMPRETVSKIRSELDAIAASPSLYRGDWKPLLGTAGFWRLRAGSWRVICELRDGELVLLVVKIAPRGDAYK